MKKIIVESWANTDAEGSWLGLSIGPFEDRKVQNKIEVDIRMLIRELNFPKAPNSNRKGKRA